MEHIISNNKPFEQTLSLKNIVGLKVISKSGTVIGAVSEVMVERKTLKVEGFLVRRGIKRPLYIGSSYIRTISSESVILSINPSVLMKGMKVISFEGEALGKVREVVRKDNRNEFREIIVSSLLKRKFSVPSGKIHFVGKVVMLKKGYDVPKKNRWLPGK
jgi:sporulation protein YlmC with PRC-barrel domain